MMRYTIFALLTLTVTIVPVTYSKSLNAINFTLRDNCNNLTDYIDSNYHFRISHLDSFVIRPHNIAEFKKSDPTLISSIYFMNPIMASGDLAEIEPPDLEVRVYKIKARDSLNNWLVSMGLTSGKNRTVIKPYRNSNIHGLKVCQSTMISPGCSFYILGSNRVYQLTSSSLEGEAMIDTFMLLP